MKTNIYCWLTALCWLVSLPVLADLPTSNTTTVTETMDTSSLPAPLYIWNNVTVGSSDVGSSVESSSYKVGMVCKSSTDSTNGACPTTLTWNDVAPGLITLTFTQDRTGQTKTLTVSGLRNNRESNYSPWTSVTFNRDPRNTPIFTYSIAQSELSSLTDGVWRATLVMDYYNWTSTYVATWTASITLTVTSESAQQVYFPAFVSTDATVDLGVSGLNNADLSTTTSGSASLDMCLYDGANAAGKTIILSLSDQGASPSDRTSGLFSVYRTGGSGADAADRIDFAITVKNPVTRAAQTVKNGESITWTAPDGGFTARLVTLPDYTTSTYCVPAPLTFTTQTSKPSTKHSGDYTGTVTVTYTPSTS
ncbi:CfaE/CblD family pilus tip adhesin [Symbiopectobacterium purcellii]|uniref:Uncharacterized protein n=1 Tax=Symbiopectobacterium purcellii TaxID=2871826 RepID=A0ABX9AMD7_9ENTR|nr:CfaE/CblD family pilus tip adhesin [Symbiopectobacterium purcellii]QZN96347.1 hypothetical protein K6K13_02420 [Symbiopectobacterium purcellii]QZN96426.1 hypothetical protein K6K13_02875 [Symbiopectobacterium purcellii]